MGVLPGGWYLEKWESSQVGGTWKAGPWSCSGFGTGLEGMALTEGVSILPAFHAMQVVTGFPARLPCPVGIRGAAAGRLQSEQQCPHRPAGHCGGHCYGHSHQPGDAEEEAVRHHQPWDRGGEWLGSPAGPELGACSLREERAGVRMSVLGRCPSARSLTGSLAHVLKVSPN